MGITNLLLDRLAERIGAEIQGNTPSQSFRDYTSRAATYSVETEISESLADLMLMFSEVPIAGDNDRARWLDYEATRFLRNGAKAAIVSGFVTGDCIVVPSWNGRNIQNMIVPSSDFEILNCYGDEITACAYVLDTKKKSNQEYKLMQAIELVQYKTESGDEAYANRYRVYVTQGGNASAAKLSDFPEWEQRFEQEWFIPNVDRLLIGRFRSPSVDPNNVNSVKGVPICYGASAPISEIHYLLDQMHNEFELSEKAILADRRMFKKEFRNGESFVSFPRGRERLFVETSGIGGEVSIKDWAPDIRHQAYLEAIDKQEQLVERAVGVSGGILSKPNEMNYQNVDNVRKSQQKTIAFVDTSRRLAETLFDGLVYAWSVLANYYGINQIGEYDLTFDWSTEYIDTFSDRQNAILAGEAIGATDATDYRMFVMQEPPEVARERVAEIKSNQQVPSLTLPI